MLIGAFDYELPPELVAQRPAEERELARLLVLPRDDGAPAHRRVSDLPEQLPPGALVVVNDTRVVSARLLGRKRDTGGRVELLLLRRAGSRSLQTAEGPTRDAEVWRALGKASKPLRFGADVAIAPRDTPEGAPALFARLLGRADEDGLLEVAVWTASGAPVEEVLPSCGHVPLPPYIKRPDDSADAERYQTVYARHDGAVAAPTAGLHITNAMLGRLALRGCELASITLHVGLGTFQPVTVDDLDAHPMHAETYAIPRAASDAITRARERGSPVVAIGTTTVRALESAADLDHPGHVLPVSGETRLLVQPGHAWRVIDGLLTNFHLPRSTLLALVCAFGGRERVLRAYEAAVRERYRFFSFGDAMFLWRHG